jgi:hypothetical protein
MYNVIKKMKDRKKLKSHKNGDKLLNMAIIMFISFSFLNIFLILNFINILNNIATI